MKSPGMIKAARELAGWSQSRLAEISGLSLPTIQRMESVEFGPLRSSGGNLEKVRTAFESAGVGFHTSAGEDCVCLKKTAS